MEHFRDIASRVIDGLTIWSPSQYVGTSFGSVTSFIVALPQGPNTTLTVDFGDNSVTSLVLNAAQSALSSTHANIDYLLFLLEFNCTYYCSGAAPDFH